MRLVISIILGLGLALMVTIFWVAWFSISFLAESPPRDSAPRLPVFAQSPRNGRLCEEKELIGAAGIDHPDKINRSHVYRRVFMNMVKTYEEIYPTLPEGCLLEGGDTPFDYEDYMKRASAESFEVVG